jgi:uncharacterized Zn finger protein (UPF0148 family)
VKCPKCSFEIQQAGTTSCPKCGVVFAKVQRAMAEEAAFNRRIAAERSISAVLEKQMEAGDEKINALLRKLKYQGHPLVASIWPFWSRETVFQEEA